MNVELVEVGRVCVSKAGRDKGRAYVIIRLDSDGQHIFLADGKVRTLVRPKKKKIKHIQLKPELILAIKEKITSEARVFDSEIAKALATLGYNVAQGA